MQVFDLNKKNITNYRQADAGRNGMHIKDNRSTSTMLENHINSNKNLQLNGDIKQLQLKTNNSDIPYKSKPGSGNFSGTSIYNSKANYNFLRPVQHNTHLQPQRNGIIQRVKNLKVGDKVKLHTTTEDGDGGHGEIVEVLEEGNKYKVKMNGTGEMRELQENLVESETDLSFDPVSPTAALPGRAEQSTSVDANTVRKLKDLRRAQRQTGQTRTVLMGASSDWKKEIAAFDSQQQEALAQYSRDMEILNAVLDEEWAVKRLTKLRRYDSKFKVEYDKDAGRGKTNPGVISIGHEGLKDIGTCRISLRHELDHAKLFNSDLTVAGFSAEYFPKDGVSKQGTFAYELEELIVRIRDYEHQQDKIKGRLFPGQDEALPRIRKAYLKLLSSNKDGFPDDYIMDTYEKLKVIEANLDIKFIP